ncbi:hypothetical protein EJB05_06415 [Eragrostis curvula]|uniref:RING-type domain-containing protein n=1 Tax=Eragrostis curvula TaxID=38414 RepID=A0A5J9WFM2_9POAL|nr:hypothetical protein EJB05_06415 [Eragrostis curvula]
MSSPATEEGAMDVPEQKEIEEELGEKVPVVVGDEGDGEEVKRLAGLLVCCICMETCTCHGAHRICCIPCGHVYGRACLEKWLHCCGNSSAKCPQCAEPFALDKIINLYTPGILWDGCCPVQVAKPDVRLKWPEQLANEIVLVSIMAPMIKRVLNCFEDFLITKWQTEKLAVRNATPMGLMGFMKQKCTKLTKRVRNQFKGIRNQFKPMDDG